MHDFIAVDAICLIAKDQPDPTSTQGSVQR